MARRDDNDRLQFGRRRIRLIRFGGGRSLGQQRRKRQPRDRVAAAAAGLDYLPRFMIYNPFNAWGKQRELPATPPSTFRQWYLKNRKDGKNGGGRP